MPCVPEKGGFAIVTFDPQAGHEQKGRRPALVVSNTLFNRHTGLAISCPVTNTFRNIPLHVAIPGACSLTGYVMAERVKSMDYAVLIPGPGADATSGSGPAGRDPDGVGSSCPAAPRLRAGGGSTCVRPRRRTMPPMATRSSTTA